ncbi:MAG TPA: hypothetical protein VE955_07475 [Candidatus Dormibacteraeota bacterium]|jgi:hypothetical protein|nr:hypothetical protein [Candidatus Dormibacteraeota bacterium]
MTTVTPETPLALIHRVIVPDKDYPKEYTVLVTDQRSIFLRQRKTRSSFVLRQEIRFGTALVTDVVPKTLEDYDRLSLEKLGSDSNNLTVSHQSVTTLSMNAEPIEHRRRDFFVWMVMKMQRETFQVYSFEMKYNEDQGREGTIKFYAVPLGAYFKPRRQLQTREVILREYAIGVLDTYRTLLSTKVTSPFVG